MRSQWLLKGVGVTVCITAFMSLYFVLLEHPQFPVTIMSLQTLDRLVPFNPWALIPYASLWLYISLVPAVLYLHRELAPYASAVTVLAVIGCTLFLFWPTAVPNFNMDWSAYPAVAFLKTADDVGNACPSLHVAFAVLTAFWLSWLLRRMAAPVALRVINIVWCALIVWSTMALKQHVALDVEAGLVLGGTVAWLHLHFWPGESVRSETAAGGTRGLGQ